LKLIWKFNLAILAVAAVAFILAAVVSYTVLHANARDEVLRNAGVMMESANASSDYTNAQVRPLLETQLKYKFIRNRSRRSR
jgi:protein-histidine pros-kinase